MKVLVIGGTRLLGRAVVYHLLESQHRVTVLSRRSENVPPAATCLEMDRTMGLNMLGSEPFDIVIDFLAYDGGAVTDALSKISDALYVMISSTWLTRLHPDVSVEQPVTRLDQNSLMLLPAVTRGYLLGKREAESVLFQSRQQGRRATALRLPIFLGDGDHTGRLDFYRRRSNDGGGIICVNGGYNLTQIAWVEDIARALIKWLPFASHHSIWDGLTDHGLSVCQIISIIARGVGQAPNLVDIPSDYLEKYLPLYLDNEPLWREVSIRPSEQNIFSTTGSIPTPLSKWLCHIKGVPDQSFPCLRENELALIERFQLI